MYYVAIGWMIVALSWTILESIKYSEDVGEGFSSGFGHFCFNIIWIALTCWASYVVFWRRG